MAIAQLLFLSRTLATIDAARLAKEAGVGELWLTHYSPSMVNPYEFSDKVKEIFADAHICKDRRSVTLNFEDEEE